MTVLDIGECDMESERAFMRGDLERYIPVLKDLMRRRAGIYSFHARLSVNQTLADIINWLRADAVGDYEKASFDAWIGTADYACALWNEWYDLVYWGRVIS